MTTPRLRPHTTRLVQTLAVGVNATVYLETADAGSPYPAIEIDTGSIVIILAPRSLADDDPLRECEVTIWRDLAGACAAMADEVAQIWAAQNTRPATDDTAGEVTQMDDEQLPQEADSASQETAEADAVRDGNASDDADDQ